MNNVISRVKPSKTMEGRWDIPDLYQPGVGVTVETEDKAQVIDFHAQVSELLGIPFSLNGPSPEVVKLVKHWERFGHLMLHHPGSPVLQEVMGRLIAARRETISTPEQVAAMKLQALGVIPRG